MNNIIDEDFFEKSDAYTSTSFETYQTFMSLEQAMEVVELLKEARIPYSLEKPVQLVDSVFTGAMLLPAAVLRIPGNYFSQLNELLENNASNNIASGVYDASHYLYDFSDEELIDVITQVEEWHPNDIILAKIILKNRGINITDSDISQRRKRHLTDLRKPKKGKPVLMIITFAACFIGAFMFTWLILALSLGMGYYYWKDTTIDPEGKKFWTFDTETRYIGILMMVLSVLGLVLGSWFVVALF
jgi:hypothetical protein